MAVKNLESYAILGLKNDPEIEISVGSSRFDKNWRRKRLKWSALLGRLKPEKCTRTQETIAEYTRWSKEKQSRVKDVGGFVGGTFKDGRRKSENVKERYILTFDMDTAPVGFEAEMQLGFPDNAWAIYSTHKHKPDAPRLRLIMPIDRPVSSEEYEAITRKLAEQIGLSYMDGTTFQASRLMYWPSASVDGEYVFEYNDGASVKADEILDLYDDWTDVSQWPTCPSEDGARKKRASRQQNPLEKEGLIGVFCRTYTVPDAIEKFLSDVYAPTDKADRYTYVNGSTYGGLVIYDDGLFCYSNHSTDPARGLDLNAFDLVRLHKFGRLDENANEETPVTKLQSFKEMMDFARKDEGTLITHDAERKAKAEDDFAGETEEDDRWKLSLDRNKNGDITGTVGNLRTIFRKDAQLRGLCFNEMTGMIQIKKPVPWKKELTEWLNSDDSSLRVYLAKAYSEKFSQLNVSDVLVDETHGRKFNPLKDYFELLPMWDGVRRVERLFVDYLGADDNVYVREATRRWLLAAIMRIYAPGCKFDYVPVLSGPPGIGKSTIAAKLGGEFFSDSLGLEDMKDKTAAEKVQGVWIMEIGELKGMRKTDVESVKSFISRRVDKYRPSYGRNVENHPRTTVFIGTSNADDYLRDVSGNRRFWPIRVTGQSERKPWDMTEDDVAQIWAEALFYYNEGERRLTLSAEASALAEEEQTAAIENDERAGLIDAYLRKKLPKKWESMDLEERRAWLSDYKDGDGEVERDSVTIMEIWAECFRLPPTAKKRQDSDDIARMLLTLGWAQTRSTSRSKLYGTQKTFRQKKVVNQHGKNVNQLTTV